MFLYGNMNHISKFSRFIPNKRFDVFMENAPSVFADLHVQDSERFVADKVMMQAKLQAFEDYVNYLNAYIEELEYYIFFELPKCNVYGRQRRNSI
jgi:hypothetical protein